MATEYNIRAHICANLCEGALCATMREMPFVCTESGTVMDAKYLEGPDTNCPLGQWAKHRAQAIVNVDTSIAQAAAAVEAAIKAEATKADLLIKDLGLLNTQAVRDKFAAHDMISESAYVELAAIAAKDAEASTK